jgi:hypothetical protein
MTLEDNIKRAQTIWEKDRSIEWLLAKAEDLGSRVKDIVEDAAAIHKDAVHSIQAHRLEAAKKVFCKLTPASAYMTDAAVTMAVEKILGDD